MTSDPSPWYLGLDTATPWLALALWSPAGADGATDVVHRHAIDLGRDLAGALMGELDAFVRAHDVAPEALRAIGVGVGPGSFTGIRIGIAAALGLGRGLGVAVAGAGTLEALALAGLDDGEVGWSAIDARRGAVYAGRFRRIGDDIDVLEEGRRRPRAEVPPGARLVEGIAPDAFHAARAARAGAPLLPRYG
ncbi:MAG: tRNA (adenosine(37)-N6)-threonylcarbamoyltransferase complex dimerization subunit type 1 TsaB [Trueperaceae bacterium]|nr:tRNA (adenosine(37)-N6)-threonylcarbamoyltransferase complex dimerization subunit type 1 TsaB [Trueperaceae bacterium]